MMQVRIGTAGLTGLAFFLSVLAPVVEAGWTVTPLNPTGSKYSIATGVGIGKQVTGYVIFDGEVHEKSSLWTGTAASWMNLDPPGNSVAYTFGVSGGHQVGQVTIGYQQASLWSSTAGSWVSLQIPGIQDYSVAWGVGGNQQVGTAYAGVPRRYRASLWTGTGASWVDLHPVGDAYTHSDAFGAGDGQQVGEVEVLGSEHASVWSGSAASWVDLEPNPGDFASKSSKALAVAAGKQVGWVHMGGNHHASMWSGTKASWVDLNPAGIAYSEALGVSGGFQAGYVIMSGLTHAVVWSGTAASVEDIHPAGFITSQATGIWSDGTNTYVSGYGANSVTGHTEAILWVKSAPCAGDLNGDGMVDDADFVGFVAAYNILLCADPAMPVGCPADLNGDGFVDDADFVMFVVAYNALVCP